MSIHKTVTLGAMRQLIDINGDVTNFKAAFTVSSPNGDTFQMVVANQNELDSGAELKYRDIQGSISGNIMADKNVYQNYYLVMRAEREIPVDVHVDFQQIAPQEIPYEPKQLPPQGAPPPVPQGPSAAGKNMQLSDDKTGLSSYWKWILVGAVVLVGGYFLYKFYLESKNNPEASKSPGKSPEKSPVKSPIKSPPVEMKAPGKFAFGRAPAPSRYY